MSKPNQQSPASQAPSEEKSASAEPQHRSGNGHSIYRHAFDAFENPTDRTGTAAGILEFVSTTLRAHGWAHNPIGDGGGSDDVLNNIDGHEAVRRFRFLAGLIDLAVELSEAEAAK